MVETKDKYKKLETKYRTGCSKKALQDLYVEDVNTKDSDKIIKETKKLYYKLTSIIMNGGNKKNLNKLTQKTNESKYAPTVLKSYHNMITFLFKLQSKIKIVMFVFLPICVILSCILCHYLLKAKRSLYEVSKSEIVLTELGSSGIYSTKVNLPKELEDVEITWSSSNENILNTTTGDVYHQENDIDITLTAVFENSGGEIEKVYHTKVFRDPNFVAPDYERIRYQNVIQKTSTNKASDKSTNLEVATSTNSEVTSFDILYSQKIVLSEEDAMDFVKEFNLMYVKDNSDVKQFKIPEESKITSTGFKDNQHLYSIVGETFEDTLTDGKINPNTKNKIKNISDKPKNEEKPGRYLEVKYDLYCNTDNIPTKVVINKSVRENYFTYQS